MNFQEWYKSYEPKVILTSEKIAQDAWNACKEEVRKILEDDKSHFPKFPDGRTFSNPYIDMSAIKEINKL